MEFLQEVLRGVRRVDDEPVDQEQDQDLNLDEPTDELPQEDQTDEMPPDGEDDELPDDAELLGDDPTDDPMAGFSDPSSPGGAGGQGGESDLPDDVAPTPEEDPAAELDDVAGNATEDPDRQGAIRSVKKAHLIFKRESGDGGYEELWIYNIGTMKDELETRKAILAGTDIPPGKTSSPDGAQSYTLWSAGNAEVLHISGLPN